MKNQKESTSELLKVLLADEILVYTKLRNYHWNVKGYNFYQLHSLFEKLYDEFAEDIDNVAERIKILGFNAPGTLKEFLELSSIKEEVAFYPDSETMLENIKKDFEYLVDSLNKSFKVVQSENNDEVTAGMILGLIERYEKHLWMMNSTLES